MTSICQQALRLCTQLRDETTIQKRRDAATKLRLLITGHRNQERLLQDARGRSALCALWHSVVGSSLFAAERAIASSKKGKLNKDDVMFPHKILLCCSEFSTFSEIDSLLSSKDVRDVLKYCLERLAEDDALEVAERDLLEMLHHLCLRPEYVAYYRPSHEMNNILTELVLRFPRLERKMSGNDAELFETAAKAFAALVKSALAVGIGLHILIPDCLECIRKWCRYQLNEESSNMSTKSGPSSVLSSMFGVAASLLTAHPEQFIMDMSRKGRRILKLAKRCYPSATGVHKDAIIEYLLAHVYVKLRDPA